MPLLCFLFYLGNFPFLLWSRVVGVLKKQQQEMKKCMWVNSRLRRFLRCAHVGPSVIVWCFGFTVMINCVWFPLRSCIETNNTPSSKMSCLLVAFENHRRGASENNPVLGAAILPTPAILLDGRTMGACPSLCLRFQCTLCNTPSPSVLHWN